MGNAVNRPPLSDLRTLATGFRDLSARALPPAPVQPAAEPPPPMAMAPVPSVATLKSIYNGADTGVVAPVVIRQVLPPFQRETFPARDGVLELLSSRFW